MCIPLDFKLARKILIFFSIINLALLPLCLTLSLNITLFYIMATSFEGFCAFILGALRVFNSLFSTIEVEDHKYIGDGFMKYQLRAIELSAERKAIMKVEGFTLIIMGILFMSPLLTLLLIIQFL